MRLLLFELLVVAMLSTETLCANEDDNPVAFLRFEHNELSKETFVHEQKLVATLKKVIFCKIIRTWLLVGDL